MAEEDPVDTVAGDFDDFAPVDEDLLELEGAPESDESDDGGLPGDDEDREDGGSSPSDLDREIRRELAPGGLHSVPPPDEIEVLSRADDMTPDLLNRNELAGALAIRAEQIAKNNDVFLPPGVEPCSTDPVKLARQEMRLRCNPLIIQRDVAHGGRPRIVERAVRDLVCLVDLN
jgi:DNA-directed RNA polymerase subunit K/omega